MLNFHTLKNSFLTLWPHGLTHRVVVVPASVGEVALHLGGSLSKDQSVRNQTDTKKK